MKMEEFSRELPMELAIKVLVRLPVKSLVRFRCVCKAWCSLISSTDFATLHLARNHKNDDDCPILVSDSQNQWMLLSGHTYEKITSDDYAILNNQNIMDGFDDFCPVGSSVNGLLLLSKDTFDPLCRQHRYQLVIWNPTIGKTRKIPTDFTHPDVRFGFSFNRSNNEYKVVAIATDPETSVHVYSLSTRTWRTITGYRESSIRGLTTDGNSLFEGEIHFVNCYKEGHPDCIVVFDVNEEVFREIELPCAFFSSYVVPYHGSLGVFNYEDEDLFCRFWVLENDQVSESWREVFSFSMVLSMPFSLLYLKNGEFLLPINMTGNADLLDVKSGAVKCVKKISQIILEYSTLYKESLVLL